jgi:hypothetical protein
MAQGSRTFRKGELLAILGEIYRDKSTGTLVLQQGATNKFLYVQEGEFVFAASNAPEDKFTQILVERGKLTNEQLELATEKKENRTIGRTLVEMGFLGSEDLLDALVEQMRKIARSAVQWDEGLAVFKAGVLPNNIARLPILTPRFVVDTALSIDDRNWVATTLGRMETPLVISAAEREVARALPATTEELRLLEQIDGKLNAREVSERAGVDAFYGARFLLALTHLGLLHLVQGFAPAPSSKAPAEPLDLSFLDEIAPSQAAPAAPPPPPTPVAAIPPAPQPRPNELPPTPFVPISFEPTPPETEPSEAQAVKQGLPFELQPPPPPPVQFLPPEPESATPRKPLPAARQKAQAETLPPPDEPGTPAASGDDQVLFEDIGMRSARPYGKILGVAAVILAVVGIGAGAVWYFFLRPTEVIPLQPTPAAGAPKKPRATQPAQTPPGQTETPSPGGVPAAAAPTSVPAAPEGSPAPVKVAETQPEAGAGAAAKPAPAPAPAQPTPAPAQTSPATAKPAAAPAPPAAKPQPAPAPATGQGHQLLAAGKYPEAASAFLGEWAKSSAGFTVEIEVACQADTVAKGVAAAGGSSEYAILPFDLKGRSCYLVVWGQYPDKAGADAALKGLPAFFQASAQPKVLPKAKVLELSRARP